MILFDQLEHENPSLRQHGVSFAETNSVSISREGLSKRFDKTAVAFTRKIMETYLENVIGNDTLVTKLKDKYHSIRILDSTEFKLDDSLKDVFPGYSSTSASSCAAIQFEYDILSKQICNLSLGSTSQSDKTYADEMMTTIHKGNLMIRDLGYYSIDKYRQLEDKGAFYISRLKSQIKLYQNKGGKYVDLDLKTLIGKLKKGKLAFFDEPVFIGFEAK